MPPAVFSVRREDEADDGGVVSDSAVIKKMRDDAKRKALEACLTALEGINREDAIAVARTVAVFFGVEVES